VSYLASRCRNVASAFNESKHVAFTVYNIVFLSCLFVPLTFSNTLQGPNIQMTAILFIVLVNAFVTMGAIFVPKIYVCYIKPELNTIKALNSGSNKSSASSYISGDSEFDAMDIKVCLSEADWPKMTTLANSLSGATSARHNARVTNALASIIRFTRSTTKVNSVGKSSRRDSQSSTPLSHTSNPPLHLGRSRKVAPADAGLEA